MAKGPDTSRDPSTISYRHPQISFPALQLLFHPFFRSFLRCSQTEQSKLTRKIHTCIENRRNHAQNTGRPESLRFIRITGTIPARTAAGRIMAEPENPRALTAVINSTAHTLRSSFFFVKPQGAHKNNRKYNICKNGFSLVASGKEKRFLPCRSCRRTTEGRTQTAPSDPLSCGFSRTIFFSNLIDDQVCNDHIFTGHYNFGLYNGMDSQKPAPHCIIHRISGQNIPGLKILQDAASEGIKSAKGIRVYRGNRPFLHSKRASTVISS